MQLDVDDSLAGFRHNGHTFLISWDPNRDSFRDICRALGRWAMFYDHDVPLNATDAFHAIAGLRQKLEQGKILTIDNDIERV